MLTVFRRHARTCPHRLKGRDWRKYGCPLAVKGRVNGKLIRKALGTRAWDVAQVLARDIEADALRPAEEQKPQPVTLKDGIRRFLQDAHDRELSEATLKKYKTLLEAQLAPFAKARGLSFLKDFDLEIVRDFRGTWRDSPISAAKKLERVKAFFRFCEDSGWIGQNPASKVRPPKITNKPTLPFSKREIERIMWACDLYPDRPHGQRQRVRALVLLLRYSGFRIRDAVMLRRDAITDGTVFLRTAKTGTVVRLPLPGEVLSALDELEGPHPDYFFHNGTAKPEYAVSVWERTFVRLFRIAGVDGAHCHRFRDTFAVELLLRGVAVPDVAVLLGHSDPSITWRHYAPWVEERQTRLEEIVRKAWG